MEIHIQNLIDDARCYKVVRDSRWLGKTLCPCNSSDILNEAKMIPHRINNVMNVSNVVKDSMI